MMTGLQFIVNYHLPFIFVSSSRIYTARFDNIHPLTVPQFIPAFPIHTTLYSRWRGFFRLPYALAHGLVSSSLQSVMEC